MFIPNANLIIQDKMNEIQNRIPQGLRIQYTTFDKVLESQTQKSAENRSNQLIESHTTTQYNDLIQSAAEKYGVDSSLIKSIIKAESDFNPSITSHAGAQGLMQLMPDTAKQLGVKDSFDPEQNIEGGTKFIAYLLDYYEGNKELALAAYNAGPGNVKKYGGIPPFNETQDYVKKVINNQSDY